MHGLCRAIGAAVPYDINGMRLLYPMRLCDWGVCENTILYPNTEAFDFAVQSRLTIGKEIRPALREACKQNNYLSFEDVNDFIDTPAGIVLTAWLCCRGSLTYEECEQWVQGLTPERQRLFCRTRNYVSAVDLMATLDWQPSLGTDGTKTNWPTWIRAVSELICPGMSPQQVGGLTLYQLRMLTCNHKELEGTVEVPSSELATYLKRRAEADERALI